MLATAAGAGYKAFSDARAERPVVLEVPAADVVGLRQDISELRNDMREERRERTEDRRQLNEFRVEVAGRLTALEAEKKARR